MQYISKTNNKNKEKLIYVNMLNTERNLIVKQKRERERVPFKFVI